MSPNPRPYRFNLKLSVKLKDSMHLPYPSFIQHLLSHTPSLQRKQLDLGRVSELETPKTEIWTIWLHPELRDQFLACKSSVLAGASHSRFVTLLLEEHHNSIMPCKYVHDIAPRLNRPLLQLPHALICDSLTKLNRISENPGFKSPLSSPGLRSPKAFMRMQSFFLSSPTSPFNEGLPLLVKDTIMIGNVKKENTGGSVMDLQHILC
jgi:hypothetical protein